jgi:hypothetical protein
MCVAAAIQPDDGKVKAIVGAKDAGIALCGSSRSESRCFPRASASRNSRRVTIAFSLLLTEPSAGAIDRTRGGQQEIPAFISVFRSPSMLTLVDASGVPAPRQCVSRLSAWRKPSRCKA